MTDSLQITLLGAPQVRFQGSLLKFRSRKVLALLIYLVVEGGVYRRDRLIDFLWPNSGPKEGRATLRSTLARLKKTLAVAGDFLMIESGKVGFNFEAHHDLDLDIVVGAAKSGDLIQLEEALTAVGGDFLEGFSLKDAPEFDDWMTLQREIWHHHIEQVFEQLSRAQAESGQAVHALETASRWVAHAPLNEFAYQRLIETHALLGNRSAALQVFDRCKETLGDELNILPSVHLTKLVEHIRNEPASSTPFNLSLARTINMAAPLELPFVGRANEYQQLISAYQHTSQNRPHVVAITGDAGLGKTRLCRAFLDWVAVSDMEADILLGRAFEMGGHLPYQPIVETLRQRIEAENAPEDLLPDVWLSELSQLLPELRDRYPDLSPPMPGDADQVRGRIFEAVARLGEALAARHTVVLFIDDIQWADYATLNLIGYLTRRWVEQSAAIFVVLAVRQENIDANTDLQDWITQLRRETTLIRLEIGLLDFTNLTLLTSQLAAKSIPNETIQRLSQWLYDETQGHPFFLTQMLQMLAQRNLLMFQPDSQTPHIDVSATLMLVESEERLPLPPTIRDLIEARLHPVSETAFALLLAGAVVGREASFDLLCQVSGLSEESAISSLEAMLHHRLLAETVSESRPYHFSHDKIREVVYEQASEARRRIYHRRALDVLTDSNAPAAELAFHALAARQSTPAFHYSLAAGDDAVKTYAITDALRHYEQAHSVYEEAECTVDDILRLYQSWGRTLELAHRFDEAISVYEALDTIAPQFNSEMMALVSLISRAILFTTPTPVNAPEQGRLLSEQALELARHLEAREIETRALWSMLLVHLYGFGNPKEAKAYGEEALKIAREFELEGLTAQVLNDLNWVYCALGELQKAQTCIEEAIPRWRALENTSMLLDSLNGAGLLYSLTGEFEQAQIAAQEGADLARAVENVWNQIAIEANLVWVYRERGEYGHIITILQKAISFAEENMPNVAPYFQSTLAFLYADLGAVNLSTQLCDRIREHVDTAPALWHLADALYAIEACVSIYYGDSTAAAHSLAQTQLDRDRIGLAPASLIAPLARCQLAQAQADHETLILEAIRFTAALERSGVRVGLADAHFFKAQGLLAQREFEKARHALMQALQAADSLTARRIQWQILLSLSELETQSGTETEAVRFRQQAHSNLEYVLQHIDEEQLRVSFAAHPVVRQLLQD